MLPLVLPYLNRARNLLRFGRTGCDYLKLHGDIFYVFTTWIEMINARQSRKSSSYISHSFISRQRPLWTLFEINFSSRNAGVSRS